MPWAWARSMMSTGGEPSALAISLIGWASAISTWPLPPNVVSSAEIVAETSARCYGVVGLLPASRVGRILRREGLYSSQLTSWRQARSRSEQAALAPKKRGPKPVAKNPLQAENTQLKRENAKLQQKLHTAGLMLDLQKKVSQILGITLPVLQQSDDDEVNS